MAYCVLITFSFQSIIHSAFLVWLWFKLYNYQPLPMLTYEVPTAYLPSAPDASKEL